MDANEEDESSDSIFLNNGSIVIPLHSNVLLQMFGFPPVQSNPSIEAELLPPPLPPPLPLTDVQPEDSMVGMRRPCPEDEEQSIAKRPRCEQEQEHVEDINPTYVRLRTGEIVTLGEEMPTTILLPESIESDPLIRKIIAKIPSRGVANRLDYLFKFIKKLPAPLMQEDDATKQHYDDLRDRVMSAFMKEYKLRFIFKKCLHRWRISKMDKTVEDEVDPITLCPPEKEIGLYDWKFRRKFLFEANTLALLIESKLMYHEHGFPIPMYPKSPKNNVEFTYAQLISIYYQLKQQGELMWALTTLRQCNFNKKRWYKYHKTAITLGAIKNSITLLDSRDAIDLLSDFIFAKMEDLRFQVTRYVTDNYVTAMLRVPNHWYLEKWKYLAMVHFEAEHFGEDRSRYLNSCCFKLFRKQPQFFNELKSLQIIR
jgi:hypothetical protein